MKQFYKNTYKSAGWGRFVWQEGMRRELNTLPREQGPAEKLEQDAQSEMLVLIREKAKEEFAKYVEALKQDVAQMKVAGERDELIELRAKSAMDMEQALQGDYWDQLAVLQRPMTREQEKRADMMETRTAYKNRLRDIEQEIRDVTSDMIATHGRPPYPLTQEQEAKPFFDQLGRLYENKRGLEQALKGLEERLQEERK